MSELDSARRLIARGKSEQAARLLAELIAEHPDHKDAWLMMAKAVKDPQQKLDC
jgi:predicted Zn-dependent protease